MVVCEIIYLLFLKSICIEIKPIKNISFTEKKSANKAFSENALDLKIFLGYVSVLWNKTTVCWFITFFNTCFHKESILDVGLFIYLFSDKRKQFLAYLSQKWVKINLLD